MYLYTMQRLFLTTTRRVSELDSLAFWCSYAIFIFFGGALILMILISIIKVELTEWHRKRNTIAMRTHKKRKANAS